MKYINKQLVEHFKTKNYFNRKEIYNFYKNYEPGLNKKTFAWRIHNLKSKNIIREVKKNIYTVADKSDFSPEISKKIIELNYFINNKYRNPDYDIWETKWVYSFLIHQPVANLIIIDFPGELADSLFYNIKETQETEVYLNPGKKEIEKYISEKDTAIIIKPLITRSPLKEINEVAVPKLEKILVDIFSEQEIFFIFSGSEMNNIFNYAFENFHINLTTLLAYAERRNKRKDIKNFITRTANSKTRQLLNYDFN
ncbi:MAG: DUF6577 family protein [Elusimicrobiota bacterium]